MHRQRQLRASARRPPWHDGDQPGQPRAQPRGNFPRVLQRNRTAESPDPVVAAYLLALRLGRWGIGGFGAVALVVALVQTVGFLKIEGRTEAEQQAYRKSISVIASP